MTSPYLDLPLRDEIDVARRTLETLRRQDLINQCTDNAYAISGRMYHMNQRMAHWRGRIKELEDAQ